MLYPRTNSFNSFKLINKVKLNVKINNKENLDCVVYMREELFLIFIAENLDCVVYMGEEIFLIFIKENQDCVLHMSEELFLIHLSGWLGR